MVRDTDLVSIQEARDLVEKAYEASRQFLGYSQERVDAILDAMAQAATRAAEELARLAVEETGYGNVADKIEKNLLCSRDLYRAIRPMKTIGILREHPETRLIEAAVPVGVVAAVLPTTNPTSTAIYKILISLKGANTIVLSPHPNAIRCICQTADLMYQAARQAGAPENVIGCFRHPTMAGTQEMMKHRRTGVILSTGGAGVVRAAYSSGKPAFGVGPGNVPAFIERSADVRKAVADIVRGKCFDHGTICSSEQALVAEESLREQALAELRAHHAYLLSETAIEALGKVLVTPQWTVNPKCAGKPATAVAQMAGLWVPPETRLLVAPLSGVGREHPLSAEKLSPVLALYFVKDFEEGCRVCESLLRFGGMGHTVAIHSRDDRLVREFGLRMPAFRVVVNSPATHGSVGYSTGLFPSMTLGCGALGGNSTGDNISPLHLINIKRIAYEIRPVIERQPYRLQPSAVSTSAPAAAPAPGPVSVPAAAAAPAMPASGTLSLDRQTIARVVERFLASKGVAPGRASSASESAAGTAPMAGAASPARASSQPAAANPPAGTTPSARSAAASSEGPTAAPLKVIDFVCESDVRVALTRNEKILIGPRTIVTPSARDLAADKDVLIMSQDGFRGSKT